MEVLLKRKSIIVEYHPEGNYFYFNWIGYHNKDSIIATGKELLQEFVAKDSSKIINDNTMVKGPWQQAAEWTASEWFPAMEKAGLKKFAWIFSKDIFAELSAQKAMPDAGYVKSFDNPELAKEWILKD